MDAALLRKVREQLLSLDMLDSSTDHLHGQTYMLFTDRTKTKYKKQMRQKQNKNEKLIVAIQAYTDVGQMQVFLDCNLLVMLVELTQAKCQAYSPKISNSKFLIFDILYKITSQTTEKLRPCEGFMHFFSIQMISQVVLLKL